MNKYVKLYKDKWNKWIEDHNISEADERSFTWGWQFDNGCDFIDSPEILLGCYICGYQDDAEIYLKEHFMSNSPFYEMAQMALKLIK